MNNFDVRTARNMREYKEAWTHHINQVAALALAAKIDYDEYVSVKAHLLEWLDEAIANLSNTGVNHE